MNDKLTLHNDISEVPLLGEWIEMVGEELMLPMPATFQLNLALEEAVVNVMNYAYPEGETHEFSVSVSKDDDTHLTFVLDDDGLAFDPTQSEGPDTSLSVEDRPIGGLGIFLVKQIMEDVSYRREADRNILTMTYEVKPLEINLED